MKGLLLSFRTFTVWFPISGGFYTVLIKPGLRLISLNNVYYYTNDKLTANFKDPANQFGWLDGVLTNASVAKEKVLTNHSSVLTAVEFCIYYQNFVQP